MDIFEESVITNITCQKVTELLIDCNGTIFQEKEGPISYTDPMFWFYFGIYAALTLGAGLMSGLTLGLLSLDTLSLEVLIKAGSGREAKYARRILPLIQQHHLLLVTLLLGNAACVESMPIFLDRISDPVTAILVSVTAVLFFGEIIPQAICKKYGLAVGYYTLPIVYFLMGVAFVIAWPISKLLDCIFGHDTSTYYKRGELKAFIDLHGQEGLMAVYNKHSNLGDDWNVPSGQKSPGQISRSKFNMEHETAALCRSQDSRQTGEEPFFTIPDKKMDFQKFQDRLSSEEVNIIKGALDLTTKVARDAMVPLPTVFMLSAEDYLTKEKLIKIMCYAHSRIPVYLGTDRRMIQGILMTKMMILQDPNQKTNIEDLMNDPKCFRPIPYVTETTPLYDLLNLFQTGKLGHMAVVVKDDIDENEIDALENLYEQRHALDDHMITVPPPVIGIITLEDVIEQLIQVPIVDESDIHRQKVCRRLLQKQKKRRASSLNATGKLANKFSDTDTTDLETRATCEILMSGSTNLESDAPMRHMPQTDRSCLNLLNKYLDNHDVPSASDLDEKTPLFPSRSGLQKYY